MAEKILKEVPEGLIEELDKKFEERVTTIQNTLSDWRMYNNGTVFYVSDTCGDDNHNGLSADRPMKTLDEVMSRQKSGVIGYNDVVLLKRGDEWHTKFHCAPGVTYSAYGEGKKPRILGSIEADLPEQWVKTDAENVYAFTRKLTSREDVGNIVFNDGQCYGMRVLPANGRTLPVGLENVTSNGLKQWKFPPRDFKDHHTLAEIGKEIPESELMFYHSWDDETLYLYSREGNPGERFFSVELCNFDHAVWIDSDVTIDNICIRYSGTHGIGGGTARNVTVRNSEVGWIGGCVQFPGTDNYVRFGNAIEIYGAVDGYFVHDCYIHQCFDCGPTIQVSIDLPEGKKVYQRNIAFFSNACREGSLEIWFGSSPANTRETFSKMVNCRMFDNYVTMSGYGWKGYNHQKNEFCSFYGGNETLTEFINCYMEGNYFWHLRRNVLKSVPTSVRTKRGFQWKNNTIIKKYGTEFAHLGSDLENAKGYARYRYDEETLQKLLEAGSLGENNFYYIPENADYDPTDKVPNPYG